MQCKLLWSKICFNPARPRQQLLALYRPTASRIPSRRVNLRVRASRIPCLRVKLRPRASRIPCRRMNLQDPYPSSPPRVYQKSQPKWHQEACMIVDFGTYFLAVNFNYNVGEKQALGICWHRPWFGYGSSGHTPGNRVTD